MGTTSMTFIDASRPTAAHGSAPRVSTRTLATTIFTRQRARRGEAVTADAPLLKKAVPFPLIVLSLGFGGSPNICRWRRCGRRGVCGRAATVSTP